MRKRKQLTITSSRSINEMIKYLEKLRDDIPKQCRQLCEELAMLGISVAVDSTKDSPLSSYVVFSKELKISNSDETEMIMFGMNVGQVFGEGVNAQEINPILMLEFGSGFEGAPPQSIIDGHIYVGQGSFPGQTHAFDPNGWFYRDKNGILHHSTGEVAHYPIQKAYDSMVTEVDSIIQRIFTL